MSVLHIKIKTRVQDKIHLFLKLSSLPLLLSSVLLFSYQHCSQFLTDYIVYCNSPVCEVKCRLSKPVTEWTTRLGNSWNSNLLTFPPTPSPLLTELFSKTSQIAWARIKYANKCNTLPSHRWISPAGIHTQLQMASLLYCPHCHFQCKSVRWR